MSRYVIDLRPDCKVIQQICESDGKVSIGAKSINYLEELNSDYINEHFSDLQDTAYQKGLEDGKEYGLDESDMREAVSYQRGLEDAWEAARKIVLSPDEGGTSLPILFAIFGSGSMQHVFRNFSASEVIEKLKAYEKKQDDKIEVGDEVADKDGDKTIVTNIHGDLFDGLCSDGSTMTDLFLDDNRKTGRHFDIEKILEAMKE